MNNQPFGPGIDLGKLGNKKTEIEPKFTDLVIKKFKQHDQELQNIIMTLGIIWSHIASLAQMLHLDPKEMAKLATEFEKNEKWLAESAEEEVKLRNIKAMFNGQPKETPGEQSPEGAQAEKKETGSSEEAESTNNVQGEVPQSTPDTDAVLGTGPDEKGARE